MKGFLCKVVALGFIVLVVFNYMAYQKSGFVPAREWLAKIQSAVIPTGKKVFNQVVNSEPSAESSNKVTVSKWVDAKGVVHYENRPVEGAQALEIDPDSNVLPPMPSVDLPANDDLSAKPKTMDEELRSLQEAKKAHFEALIR